MNLFEGPTVMSGYAGEDLNPFDAIVTMCPYHEKGAMFYKTWNTFAEHMAEEHPDLLIQLYDYETEREIHDRL